MINKETFPYDWEARIRLCKLVGIDPDTVNPDPDAIYKLAGCLSDLDTHGLDAVELVREVRDSSDVA